MPFLSLLSKFSEMDSSVGVGSSTYNRGVNPGGQEEGCGGWGGDHVVDAVRHLRLHPFATVFSHVTLLHEVSTGR